MEQGYLSTVARSEQFSDDPAVRFYWGRVEAAANGSDPNLTERYRQLFLAAPALLAALTELETWWANWMPDNAFNEGGFDALEQARAALALATGEVDAR